MQEQVKKLTQKIGDNEYKVQVESAIRDSEGNIISTTYAKIADIISDYNDLDNVPIINRDLTEIELPEEEEDTGLPDGYTLCEYIEMAVDQYTDTFIKANQDTIIETTVVGDTKNTRFIFGARTGTGLNEFSIVRLSNVMRVSYGAKTYNLEYTNPEVPVLIRMEGNKLYVDDTSKYVFDTQTFETPTNIAIGTVMNNGNKADSRTDASNVKYYGFKIWQGNILVRDMIPCLNKAGIPCFYDLISQLDFVNINGTSNFKYGLPEPIALFSVEETIDVIPNQVYRHTGETTDKLTHNRLYILINNKWTDLANAAVASFTHEQIMALNSGITQTLVNKITDNELNFTDVE